jgi:hypothetical protein
MIDIELDSQVTGLCYLFFESKHEEEMADQLYALLSGWA